MLLNPYRFAVPGGGGDPGGGDELPEGTIVRLRFQGADGSTDIIDDTGKTWTNASPSPLSTAQAYTGTSSLRFSGAGWIECTHADLAFGTGDFRITIAFWPVSDSNPTLFENRFGSYGSELVLYDGASSDIVPTLYIAGGNRAAASAELSYSTWHVLVVERIAGKSRLIIDGVQAGSDYTDSSNYTHTKVRIGANLVGDARTNGYIGLVQIQKF